MHEAFSLFCVVKTWLQCLAALPRHLAWAGHARQAHGEPAWRLSVGKLRRASLPPFVALRRLVGVARERSLAGGMMPAPPQQRQAEAGGQFPYASPDGAEPPHFVAEMFFLTQRLVHVGLMPTGADRATLPASPPAFLAAALAAQSAGTRPADCILLTCEPSCVDVCARVF